MKKTRGFLHAVRTLSIVFVFCGGACLPGHAAPLFPNPVFDVGTDDPPLASGDFNGDGLQDLAVANWRTGKILVFLGDSDRTFDPQPSIPVGHSPFFIAAEDLNADGTQDLLVSAAGVSVLLGNGAGTFQPPFQVWNGFAGSLAARDFNGDGTVDLVAVGYGEVDFLPGVGNAAFGPPLLIAQGNYFTLAVADFNNDDRWDLAICDYYRNRVLILAGNGDGTFGAPSPYDAGSVPGFHRCWRFQR